MNLKSVNYTFETMAKEVFRLFIDDVRGVPVKQLDGSLKFLVKFAVAYTGGLPSYQTVWRNIDKANGAYAIYVRWGYDDKLVLLRFVSHLLLLEQ